jgi:O-antigen/teichoic acid export membrane protein
MVAVIVLASALTGAVPVVLAWRGAATRPAWSGEAGRMRALLKYGLPLVAAGLLAGPIINNVIPAMLALTVSPQEVAMYSASLALQVLVYMPTAAVEVAILPNWSSSGGPSRHAFQTVTRWALLLSSVPFAILWLAPSAVLSLAYGARYAGAGLLVQITALSALFAASVGPNEAALKAGADTRGILVVRLIAAALGLATAWALMSRSGALGAVVGFSVASLMLNALYAARLWRRQRVQPLSSKYLRALIAIAAALFGTRFVLSRVSDGVAAILITAAVAYPCFLLVSLVLLGAEEPKQVMSGLRALLRRRMAVSTQ